MYHLVVQRTDAQATVANERVLVIEADRVRMLFAFGPPTTSAPAAERMRLVQAALAPTLTAIRWGEQVHGRVVASLAAEPGLHLRGVACVGRCDALMTSDMRLGLVVWTADCVPVLFSGDGVIAAVHAGWRGAVADIAAAVVRRFGVEYGVGPERLHAVLGPAISGPRYEVGAEVIDSLRSLTVDEARWRMGSHVDLRGFLAARLENLGLDPAQIHVKGPCTASTPELASYRRDGAAAGRQWAMIYRIARR